MQSADSQLSEFITRTSADAGLARDLLQSHNWDFRSALCAYYVMKGIVFEAGETVNDTGSARKHLPVATHNPGPLKSSSEPSLSSATSSPCKLAASRSDVSETDAQDDVFPKKLTRGISRATDNVSLVSKARNDLAHDFGIIVPKSRPAALIESAPESECTFTLPDLSIHSPDFSEFLEKDLIEKSSLVSLQSAGRLNWWSDLGICQKLWPLATTGDGNCLLHAASLGMWGWHDRLLTLRKALHAVLSESSFTDAFYRRWRWQSSQQNEAAGLVLCEEEWAKEWETLLRMASSQPRARPGSADREMSGGKKASATPDSEESHVYESLEELHILALAHVLRRPILVVADTMLKDVTGQPFAPIPFGGIYLPIECKEECHTSPLCLTYDAAHFSALVAMDKETFADKTPQLPTAIPLVDADGKLLPLQFALDPGPDVVWNKQDGDNNTAKSLYLSEEEKLNLLKKFMDVVLLEKKEDTEKSDLQTTGSTCSETVVRDKVDSSPSKCRTLPARLETTSRSTESRLSHRTGLFRSLRRSFGTLRRSMSRSIRANLGSLAKRNTAVRIRQSFRLRSRKKSVSTEKSETDGSPTDKDNKSEPTTVSNEKAMSHKQVVCAMLHTERRHDYQEEIVRNYLSTARIRFLAAQKSKNAISNNTTTSSSTNSSSVSSESPKGDDHYASPCVTSGCLNYGTAASSYLCSSCFSDQKKQMDNRCEKTETSKSLDQVNRTETFLEPTPGNQTPDHQKSKLITEEVHSDNFDVVRC